MELELLRSKLPDYLERISEKERSGLWHCPLCGSGTHRGNRSTGAFSVYQGGMRWHCFACGQSGDIFTLIGLVEHLDAFPDQLRFACNLFGIPYESMRDSQCAIRSADASKAGDSMISDHAVNPVNPDYSVNFAAGEGFAAKPHSESSHSDTTTAHSESRTANYNDYILRCAGDVGKTDYWTKIRGFSAETVTRFELGFDAQKQAVVIPYDRAHTYYITRSVKQKAFRKPKTTEAGEEPIFNETALDQAETPCFVCESPIDAISVMAAGAFQAVSVGGTGVRKLVSRIEKQPPRCPLILSFDADEAGQKATDTLAKELTVRGIAFAAAEYDLSAYPDDMRKDANDFFRGNRAAFVQQLTQNAENVQRRAAKALDEERAENDRCSGAFRLASFLDSIHGANAAEAIPTGFEDLDAQLDGGLFAGLYILGAVSSLGKTTFMLQIADQIAAAGQDVLYFSLEMSAGELMAKSISRQTYLLCGGDTKKAKTVRGITTKSRYYHYSAEENRLIDRAVLAYQEYAGNIYYYEGIGDIGAAEIRERTAAHIRMTGRTPVVMIDYLQIIAPYDLRASDKQNTDKAVLELKRLSRDYRLPVFVISSLNRESYATGEIEMSAFKESGAIEYGSDVLMGLQVQGVSGTQDKVKAIQEAKEHAIRNVEVKILKNRSGQTGGRIGLRYYSLFNCFEKDCSYVQRKISDGIRNDDFVPAR